MVWASLIYMSPNEKYTQEIFIAIESLSYQTTNTFSLRSKRAFTISKTALQRQKQTKA